jgi:DNA modification methylase
VAKELGIEQVPVVFLNIPSLEREKELNLRLNRNTGEWDWELLKGFDMDLLLDVGFDDVDLGHVWDDSLETEDDGFDVDKELAKIKKPTTKPGEMYQLGNHRLICGDSTKIDVIKKLVGKTGIDMLYCDPPYNINLDYSKGVSTSGKYGGKTNDKKSPTDYRAFLKTTVQNGLTVAKPDTHVFYWCDENLVGILQSLYQELGITNKRVCLWIKNNFNMTPQVAFNKAYEPCVYGARGKPYLAPKIQNLNELMNKEIGTGNRLADDIMDLFNIWLAKRVAGQDYEHPTEKPPTLHEKALRRCTKPGDAVLDLFGGSGSTLIACEQLKRRAFIVEIEPIFCDLIIRRYETLAKTKAKRIN